MEFNAKNIAIAVAATAVFVGVGVIVAKLVSGCEEKQEVDTETDEITLEEARRSSLANNTTQFTQAAGEFTMSTLYEEDGSLNPRVRIALIWAILIYVNNVDLSDRQARKVLPFLDGVVDVPARNELGRIAKRVIGKIYLALKDDPDLKQTYESVELLLD